MPERGEEVFARSLPVKLLRAREASLAYFRPVLADHDLTEQQYRVLVAVRDSAPIDFGDLADLCSLLPPSLSGILNRLQQRGLVTKASAPNDRRRSVISLTATSEVLVGEVSPQIAEAKARMVQRYGEQQMELLYTILDDFIAAVAPGGDEGHRSARAS